MNTTTTEKNVQFSSLILASLLLGISTFYWQNGEYSVSAATLLILSLFFWVPAFQGLFGLFKNKYPRYATYGFLIALFGCVSGICFAFLGYLTSIFHINHQDYLEALSRYPFSSQLLLFASGPLFPLSIIVLGIMLATTKKIPLWQALLFSLAGILFPVSRITRMQLIAHGADLFFLITCIIIALRFFKRP
ncbi:MAG TPA: hypothetical protein VFW07_02695 [Parafilimonas sp.]|nr:hypothetical protein [Parafilimonas sp.]